MRVLGVCLVISVCLLALVPALAYEDDDDDFQAVASRLDDKLQNLEKFNTKSEDVDDQPALEEDDDNDNDNDNDADDNNDNALENTKQASSSAADRVIRDVASLEEKLAAAPLAASARAQVQTNLEAIRRDAKKYASETSAHRQTLAEAMTDRMKALRLQLEEANGDKEDEDDDVEENKPSFSAPHQSAAELVRQDLATIRTTLAQSRLSSHLQTRASHLLEEISTEMDSGASTKTMMAKAHELRQLLSKNAAAHSREFEEEEARVAKVSSDISQLEEAIDSSNLPSHIAKMARDNLEAIKSDTHRFERAESDRRSRLAKAIHLRMEALNIMLKHSTNKPSVHNSFEEESSSTKEARVMTDVQQLESAVSSMPMSAHKKHEMMENLEAIKRDAQELPHANAHRAQSLKGAMELRIKALKQQL